MQTIQINGEEHPTMSEAIQHLDAAGIWDHAIRVGGKNITTTKAEVARLESLGVYFAYLHDCNGRLITVPVN